MVTMADVARVAGVSISTVSHVLNEVEQELRIVRALQARRVDGLILAPSADAVEETLALLATQNLPVVLIDRLPSPDFDQVGTENEDATARLVTHLVQHGHERIGMLAGLAGLSTTIERVA